MGVVPVVGIRSGAVLCKKLSFRQANLSPPPLTNVRSICKVAYTLFNRLIAQTPSCPVQDQGKHTSIATRMQGLTLRNCEGDVRRRASNYANKSGKSSFSREGMWLLGVLLELEKKRVQVCYQKTS